MARLLCVIIFCFPIGWGSGCGGSIPEHGGIACWSQPCISGFYPTDDGCRCRVPPTGVQVCWSPDKKKWVACSDIIRGEPGCGQDGHFDDPIPSFTPMPDGTIRDNRTGLVWAWLMASAPIAQDVTWDVAKNLCQELERQGALPALGFRLPDAFEILSILDFGFNLPDDYFSYELQPLWLSVAPYALLPNTSFWTWSPSWNPFCVDAMRMDRLVGVGMCLNDSGEEELRKKRYSVLCVGGTSAQPPEEERFIDLGETVFDRLTGLEWEKSPSFKKPACPHIDECYPYGCEPCDNDWLAWPEALSACLSSQKAGGGWRLPNVKEVLSLVVYQPDNICPLDEVFGKYCDGTEDFLTSTPSADYVSPSIWGFTVLGNMARQMWVARCVRGP